MCVSEVTDGTKEPKMKFEANIAGVACVVDVESLKPESLSFLLEYGIRQYLQDGAAVSKTFTDKERKGQVKTDDEIAAEKTEGVKERLENIANGEFTRRTTEPKLSPEEAKRNSLVIEEISAAARKSNTKLPKRTGTDEEKAWWKTNIARHYAKNQARIDKEVARAMKAMEAIEVDFTDLPTK